jgi:hypothetical protein
MKSTILNVITSLGCTLALLLIMCYLVVLGNEKLIKCHVHFSIAVLKQRKNPLNFFSGGAFDPGIDLLKGLNLHANISQYEGVSVTQGTQKKNAFKLQGTNRKLVLPFKTYERAVELLKKNSDFTFAATLKQDERNPGTIISFSNGYNR